jgi:hypothetical protein
MRRLEMALTLGILIELLRMKKGRLGERRREGSPFGY